MHVNNGGRNGDGILLYVLCIDAQLCYGTIENNETDCFGLHCCTYVVEALTKRRISLSDDKDTYIMIKEDSEDGPLTAT